MHDIYAWSITTGYEVLSAHVTADMDVMNDSNYLLQRLRKIASKEFGLSHVTIQLEVSAEKCEEAHHVLHDEEVGGE